MGAQMEDRMTECLEDEILSRKTVMIASNRGPVTFQKDQNGEIRVQRGAGGLVTALSGLVEQIDATWIACALTDEDASWREGEVTLQEGGNTIRVRFISPSKEAYDGYYNVISNPLLWFLQHSMWNLPNAPVINQKTWQAWENGYVAVNHMFARAITHQLATIQKPALVMLQDYHLYLAPMFLRRSIPPRERPTILHFTHIPWPGPEYWGMLPPAMRQGIIESLCAADVLGFQTNADALNFLRTCQAYLPRASVKYKHYRIWYRNHATYVRDFPISIDVKSLQELAFTEEVKNYRSEVEAMIGNRQVVVRIDRIEPSKNIVRGFQAFEELLDLHPEHREKVTFLALLVPSRMDVQEYQDYLDNLMASAGHVNAKLGTSEWEPIRVLVGENYPRAIAALKLYDVLLVNSIADGMNLVAKEGPVVNQRDGVLILSERVGAREQLETGAMVISPCDVYATAEAMHQALGMPEEQRKEHSRRLRWLIEGQDINDWLCKQIETVSELNL